MTDKSISIFSISRFSSNSLNSSSFLKQYIFWARASILLAFVDSLSGVVCSAEERVVEFSPSSWISSDSFTISSKELAFSSFEPLLYFFESLFKSSGFVSWISSLDLERSMLSRVCSILLTISWVESFVGSSAFGSSSFGIESSASLPSLSFSEDDLLFSVLSSDYLLVSSWSPWAKRHRSPYLQTPFSLKFLHISYFDLLMAGIEVETGGAATFVTGKGFTISIWVVSLGLNSLILFDFGFTW